MVEMWGLEPQPPYTRSRKKKGLTIVAIALPMRTLKPAIDLTIQRHCHAEIHLEVTFVAHNSRGPDWSGVRSLARRPLNRRERSWRAKNQQTYVVSKAKRPSPRETLLVCLTSVPERTESANTTLA